ncbi:fasciclin-like protein FLA15 [Hordeum vulgare]|uniref:Predicted protein n=1 Tax=Hordeum vulgare subsp. vulgare TaxID=112509 RepID=F2D4R6_HORVV|nr:fasciclin-like arabinogalactan protein 12 [Hordeum vulgare subsp. vulgare]KAE8786883.1 fasciclin-like protein FLA15 [Hordeum vulgare]KAI5020278.1 hypothetical protein ZWY2020_045166 [Hordeum vulgare]BAJ90087.1 predicted protein [Hordeum vulgare subsp. vulgare]BAK06644.1 predicted protein [Hordeum vulgare subsp. vulgare]
MASASRILLVAALLFAASAMTSAQKAKAPAKPAPAAADAPAAVEAPAKPAPAAADAPGAAAADGKPPTDVTAVLEKSGKYSKFLALLKETRVETQINAQLTDSYNGLTIFAPTDAAFDGLKAGTFNTLTSQEQIQMVLYCVLPRFYSLSMLGTLNGKVSTQASGHSGPYTYKIKPSANNVNVSTGVKGNNMLLGSVVSKDFPLAVYSIEKVPLPYELFGPQPPTPAPAPAPAPTKSKPKKKKKSAGIAEAPEADDATADDDTEKSAAASLTSVARWTAVLGAAVLGAMF